MRHSWKIRRIIAAVFALSLLGLGVNCLVDAYRLDRNFEQWQTAKPVDSVIDLSVPGRFILPFNQTCSSSHGEFLMLRFPVEILQATTTPQLLAGLSAKLEIADKSGSLVVSSDSAIMWEETNQAVVQIFRVSPFRKGAYNATVTVLEGAPALKNIPQRLEGHYELCGLERLPATIGTIVGLVSFLVGSIIIALVSLRVA